MAGSRHTPAIAALLVAAALLAACGSSKPSYCSSLADLKSSVSALPSTNVVQNGVSALKSAVTKVQDNANAVINDAKSDFPNETSALQSSVNTLVSSAKSLASNPSASAIAQTVGDASGVSTAVKNFSSATSSKCS
jgi:predicted PurR-regulated permease PerM